MTRVNKTEVFIHYVTAMSRFYEPYPKNWAMSVSEAPERHQRQSHVSTLSEGIVLAWPWIQSIRRPYGQRLEARL
jgi:hypothetical protein